MVVIGNDWDEVIGGEFSKEYYLQLREFLRTEYSQNTIYPDMYHIFTALKLTPYSSVKVVIFGQDPYHEPGQAHGLCFSVQDGTMLPPSLKNIYKELESDLGIPPAKTGDLTSWAKQGVLLLNTVLTVRRGQANSHKGKGWEILTDEIIRKLNEHENPIVFILWGANARSKKALITNPQHLIIESAHPSPLSAFSGFFGSRPFSRTNQFLAEHGEVPVNWEVG
ncbi:MAG: uracil-DNA glycosylase [Oscillospiraceae bacterium]|nr:uracil-DNA glycosylase [Oscillospiraceae bacterium]